MADPASLAFAQAVHRCARSGCRTCEEIATLLEAFVEGKVRIARIQERDYMARFIRHAGAGYDGVLMALEMTSGDPG